MKNFKNAALVALAVAVFSAPSVSFGQCWRPFGGLFSGWRCYNYGACDVRQTPAPCGPVEQREEETNDVETCVYPEKGEPCAPCEKAETDAAEHSKLVERELEEMGETEKQMFARLNQYRRAHGLSEVVFEKSALKGCRDHSLSMARCNWLYHNSPSGWKEICAYAGDIESAFYVWDKSLKHRRIMKGPYRRAAASYAFDNCGRGFWTIRFAY